MPEDFFWVAVRTGFTCNSCRFLAPLDGLDVDGAVECAQCGLRQRFDVPLWSNALKFAHGVADLAGPHPEGRAPHPSVWVGTENPYKAVGDTKTMEEASDGMLQIAAGPGHPVCHKCALPLAAALGPQGVVTTQCSKCGERATWQLPPEAANLHEALVGVVSDENRSDRPRVLASMEAGATSLKCPGCGAPLKVQGEDGVQTCPYCSVSAIVPWRRIVRMRNEVPAPEVWWLLMRGPSLKRLTLEAPGAASATTMSAKKLIRRTDGPSDISNDAGVHEAPIPPGPNWPQILFTVVAGLIALAIGYLVTGR